MSVSMNETAVTRSLLAVLVLASFGAPASAQVNPDSVKLRNDCRLAAQVLTTGQPAPHRREALSVIGLCGREGVPALLAAWSSAPSNRADLQLLVTSTRAYATDQIVETLLGTLNQSGRPLEVRVASLLVLLTYAEPAVVPGFEDLLGDTMELLVRRYGTIDHPYPVVGLETLTGSVTDRIRAALQPIVVSDPDAHMRVAARVALLNAPLR
jgi:hypothetical protein